FASVVREASVDDVACASCTRGVGGLSGGLVCAMSAPHQAQNSRPMAILPLGFIIWHLRKAGGQCLQHRTPIYTIKGKLARVLETGRESCARGPPQAPIGRDGARAESWFRGTIPPHTSRNERACV